MGGIQATLQKHGEKLRVIVYFFIVAIIGGELFQTMGSAWRNSQIFSPLIRSLGPTISISLEQFGALWFGVFIGLLILFTLDPKKRWQGVLLWLGTGSALIALRRIGLFLPNIDFVDHMPLFILGIVVGFVVGGGRKLTEIQTAEPLEFRRAATLIFYLISIIIVAGIIEYHITFPELLEVTNQGLTVQNSETGVSFTTAGMFYNSALGAVFIITMREFIQYDAEESFFVLGPVGSGKSLFLAGMSIAVLDEAENRKSDAPLNPSSDLMELVSSLDAASQESGWEVDPTAGTDVSELRFQYLSGKLFPKNLDLSSLDYAGEYLFDLPDALMASDENIGDSTLRILADEVQRVDTLILILDMERYSNNESLEIESYFDILNTVSNKDVILVAAKADILAEEFKNDQALEPHLYFDEFKEYVNDRLVRGNESVRTLVQDTANSEIHPVYYQTTVNDIGERVPLRNHEGKVETVGFNELLNEIG